MEKLVIQAWPQDMSALPVDLDHPNRTLVSGCFEERCTVNGTERALLMRAKRIEQEYEMGLMEGTLHEAKDVEQVVTTMILNFRSRIMAIPSRLAARLSKETDTTAIFEILKEATDDALNELADYDALFGNDTDST